MAVPYNFIKNDNAAGASTGREEKIREKKERRMVLPSHGVVAKQHDVEFAVQVY